MSFIVPMCAKGVPGSCGRARAGSVDRECNSSSPSARGSWSAVWSATECEQLCRKCSACNYVSYTWDRRECDWYHKCNLDKLETAQYGHCSHRVQMSSSADAKSDTVRIIDIFSYGGKHYDRTLRLRLHEMASIPNLLHVLLEMGTPLSRNLQFAAVVEQGHFDLRDLAWAPFRQRIQHVKLNGSQLFASLEPCTGTVRACEPTHPNARLAQHIMRTVGFSTALRMVWPPAASKDWVLLSDIDEIPRAQLFVNSLLASSSVRFQLEKGRVFALAGPCFYYSVECMASPLSWESQWSLGPRLATAATLRNSSWNAIRSGKGIVATVIRDASWHFGYLMTHSEILTKLCFNTDPAVRKLCGAPDALSVIKQSVAECRDLFGTNLKHLNVPLIRVPAASNPKLPSHVLSNLHLYTNIISTSSSIQEFESGNVPSTANHLRSTRTSNSECTHIFVDVGANIGDSLAAWFNLARCVPGERGCRDIFPSHLSLTERKKFCAVAFEMNPILAQRLIETVAKLRQEGANILEVHHAAFSTSSGNGYALIDDARKALGSSLALSKKMLSGKPAETIQVPTMDGIAFLRNLSEYSHVVLKLDVEGLEYNLLPDLLMSGVLCHNVRDLFLEWHTGKNTLSWQEEQLPLPDVDLRRAFTWMLKRAKSRCQLRLHDWI